MNEPLFSIRMRASHGGSHVSGAERIVSHPDIKRVTAELASRAMSHERGRPDTLSITVDSLAGRDIVALTPLTVSSIEIYSVADARAASVTELVRAGVSEHAAMSALSQINDGAAPDGRNMRGAMIMDAITGARLEPDRYSGVRARAVDYHVESLPSITETLAVKGLDRSHIKEALAVATKVANAPGTVAELCISDDPSYVTGYVASPRGGYVRITPMKNHGDPMGGRAFFVDTQRFDMDKYIHFMRETPVLVRGALEFTE